jgi:hypothetical protein
MSVIDVLLRCIISVAPEERKQLSRFLEIFYAQLGQREQNIINSFCKGVCDQTFSDILKAAN